MLGDLAVFWLYVTLICSFYITLHYITSATGILTVYCLPHSSVDKDNILLHYWHSKYEICTNSRLTITAWHLPKLLGTSTDKDGRRYSSRIRHMNKQRRCVMLLRLLQPCVANCCHSLIHNTATVKSPAVLYRQKRPQNRKDPPHAHSYPFGIMNQFRLHLIKLNNNKHRDWGGSSLRRGALVEMQNSVS